MSDKETVYKYTYWEGRPSWHQAKAGLTYAARASFHLTAKEHEQRMARYREDGETVSWRQDPISTP